MSTEDLWKLMEPPRKVRPTQQVAESLAKCLGYNFWLQQNLPKQVVDVYVALGDVCSTICRRTFGA
jgi:hypothetical protein